MPNIELKKFASDAELARAAASDWLALVQKTNRPWLTAFSGGRIAKTHFQAIAELSLAQNISLQNVEFFWADERCVPPDSPDSNFLLAQQNLFDKVAVAPGKIHRLKGEVNPAEAVAEANAAVTRVAAKNSSGQPVLDLIFLGVGEDGHVASLMPNIPDSITGAAVPFIKIENSPKPPPNRLSMTYDLIAAARAVWVLAAGAGKAEALRQSLKTSPTTPLGRVIQSRAQTVIYTDIAL